MMGLAELAVCPTNQPGVHLYQGTRHCCRAYPTPLAESSGALRLHRWPSVGAGMGRRI
jgi:hypothetical protein